MNKKQQIACIGASLVMAGATHAAPIGLQNATSDVSLNSGGFVVANAIDGTTTGANGWHTTGDLESNATIVFETQTDLDDPVLTFTLTQNFVAAAAANNPFTFQKLRFSYTTDDRSTFADGLDNGGDVTANWTVLTPSSATIDSGESTTINGDNSINFARVDTSGTYDGAVYTVTATAATGGITGFRVEALTDSGDVAGNAGHVGWSPNGGAAILTEFTVDAVVPEPGSLALLGLGGLCVLRRRRRV